MITGASYNTYFGLTSTPTLSRHNSLVHGSLPTATITCAKKSPALWTCITVKAVALYYSGHVTWPHNGTMLFRKTTEFAEWILKWWNSKPRYYWVQLPVPATVSRLFCSREQSHNFQLLKLFVYLGISIQVNVCCLVAKEIAQIFTAMIAHASSLWICMHLCGICYNPGRPTKQYFCL